MKNELLNDDNKRIGYIDFLKFIGLTGIIIAHVEAPDIVMMFRSFDVPLMVIISAILASYSYDCSYKNNRKYYFYRLKRLIIPTWLFLVLFFLFEFFLTRQIHDIEYYVNSFLLTRYGISFVWIILIYLYCALLIPFFSRYLNSIKKSFLIILIYIAYELAFYFQILTQYRIIDTTFYYIIPYGCLAYIGYNYSNMSKKSKYIILFSQLTIFGILLVYYWSKVGTIQLISTAKYPPRLYYLSYGIFCSFLFLLFCENKSLNIYNNHIIMFVSVHSMWIYLWHIFILYIYAFLKLPNTWYIKFFIVYIISIFIVYFVNKCFDFFEKKYKIVIAKYLR